MRRTAALILGGGPAGAAAGITLAGAGRHATILTRTPGDALCGGFLSWRTLATLDRLGIAADALNPATITRLRLFAGGRAVAAALPAPARAVSRARLDRLLLDRAAAAGAEVVEGVSIRSLDGGVARLADGSEWTGDAVLLATGKHDLRGAPRPAPSARDPAIGLRVRVPARAIAPDTIELHLFDGGYAGLAVQEDGWTNICMAIRRSRMTAAGSPRALLEALAAAHPDFAARLDAIDPATSIDAVANVPYGWRAGASADGAYRLGDQAAVIPSLAGEGMGIAVASGIAAAAAVLRGEEADGFQRGFARRAARPLAVAGAIRAAAEHPLSAHALLAGAHLPGLVQMIAHLTRIGRHPIDEAH